MKKSPDQMHHPAPRVRKKQDPTPYQKPSDPTAEIPPALLKALRDTSYYLATRQVQPDSVKSAVGRLTAHVKAFFHVKPSADHRPDGVPSPYGRSDIG